MKAFIQALVIGLLLAQSVQAGVVRRVSSESEQGAQLFTALKISPNNYFRCVVTEGDRVHDTDSHLDSYLEKLKRFGEFSITQYDGPNPLIETFTRSSDYGFQMYFYSNTAATEVIQVVKKEFKKVQVNKGTLAPPKLVFEDQVYSTTTCKKFSK